MKCATKPQSEKPDNPLPNTQIKHITQFQDGRVKISFDRASSSSRFFDVSSSKSLDLGRISQIPFVINLSYKDQPHYRETLHHNPDLLRVINLLYTEQADLHPNLPLVINLPYTSLARYSTSDLPPTSLRNVDYSSNIARPVYTEPQGKSHSPSASSTTFAITENIAHELNTIDKEFIPDKVFLPQDFYASHNKVKRT